MVRLKQQKNSRRSDGARLLSFSLKIWALVLGCCSISLTAPAAVSIGVWCEVRQGATNGVMFDYGACKAEAAWSFFRLTNNKTNLK
jgi:hypothetical protein